MGSNAYPNSPGYKDLYTYEVKPLNGSLAAGETQTVIVRISGDAMFVWEKASYKAATDLAVSQVEATRVIPYVTVSIYDSGSSRQLQESPVDVNAMAGHEGLPYLLPVSRQIEKNSTVKFTLTNYGDVDYPFFAFYMLGYKIFDS